jgi:hypothetical protein
MTSEQDRRSVAVGLFRRPKVAGESASPASSGECLFDRTAVTVAISELQLGLAGVLLAVVGDLPGEFDIDTERLKLGHHWLKLGLVEVCTAAHPGGRFLAAIEHDGDRDRHDHRRDDGQPD